MVRSSGKDPKESGFRRVRIIVRRQRFERARRTFKGPARCVGRSRLFPQRQCRPQERESVFCKIGLYPVSQGGSILGQYAVLAEQRPSGSAIEKLSSRAIGDGFFEEGLQFVSCLQG